LAFFFIPFNFIILLNSLYVNNLLSAEENELPLSITGIEVENWRPQKAERYKPFIEKLPEIW
jgi:hypothetical protein